MIFKREEIGQFRFQFYEMCFSTMRKLRNRGMPFVFQKLGLDLNIVPKPMCMNAPENVVKSFRQCFKNRHLKKNLKGSWPKVFLNFFYDNRKTFPIFRDVITIRKIRIAWTASKQKIFTTLLHCCYSWTLCCIHVLINKNQYSWLTKPAKISALPTCHLQ